MPRDDSDKTTSIATKLGYYLRREYFYTTRESPSDGLPLLVDLIGYTAVLAVFLGISFTVFATIGAPGPGIISLILYVLLWLMVQLAFLHVVLWVASKLWRLLNGYPKAASAQ
ncbi:hypothetical protein [Natranaeroarchaeum aerophilus]|uniref:Uncharacterized protein n=1 Tax=Natranaeroarchaeum aerophilus TaxID=2917711 RepID=A0AAE3FPG3_9EURY|nr:hypothetical protein [Natranaeroarchaeum aerophilus]MCL9812761.1 hypothetical protein [Natranaeroarchaeum aerophilus]